MSENKCCDHCGVTQEDSDQRYFAGIHKGIKIGEERGRKDELERILTILDHNADTMPVNWLIHLLKGESK
jgi:hypothetical protein